MEVGYGQVVAVLGAMHPGLDKSIVARLQYLQREEFPIARQPGSVRTDYGAEGLMKLALAFEILAAGAPPSYVVDLVEDGWEAAGEMMAAAWLDRTKRSHALLVFVRIKGIGAKDRDVGRLGTGTADDLRQWLQGAGDDRRILVVDALRVIRALDEAIGRGNVGVDLGGVGPSLDEWADRRLERLSAR